MFREIQWNIPGGSICLFIIRTFADAFYSHGKGHGKRREEVELSTFNPKMVFENGRVWRE
jgi:hypothetical protein